MNCQKTNEPRSSIIALFQDIAIRFRAMVVTGGLRFGFQMEGVLGIGRPNGVGRITVFSVISGLIPADSGELEFYNKIITDDSPFDFRLCAELLDKGGRP